METSTELALDAAVEGLTNRPWLWSINILRFTIVPILYMMADRKSSATKNEVNYLYCIWQESRASVGRDHLHTMSHFENMRQEAKGMDAND